MGLEILKSTSPKRFEGNDYLPFYQLKLPNVKGVTYQVRCYLSPVAELAVRNHLQLLETIRAHT